MILRGGLAQSQFCFIVIITMHPMVVIQLSKLKLSVSISFIR